MSFFIPPIISLCQKLDFQGILGLRGSFVWRHAIHNSDLDFCYFGDYSGIEFLIFLKQEIMNVIKEDVSVICIHPCLKSIDRVSLAVWVTALRMQILFQHNCNYRNLTIELKKHKF